ncbi:MAG: glycosyltransferase family 4 protein [Ahniella sp.]|nr:glycosyltransferase family 4 protein [Ahniella sp.]
MRLRSKHGIGAQDTCFLFVGKLIDVKQPTLLVKAFRQMNRPDSHLVFVGSGVQEAALRAEAGDHSRIHMIPFANQSEMPGIYAMSDVVVLPSSSETWGLVVNEAQCLGKPCVVSDQVGCHPDLVIPGQTGWVFRSGDADALKDCLLAAASDPAGVAILGDQARILSQRYSYEQTSAGLMAALDHVARTSRTSCTSFRL